MLSGNSDEGNHFNIVAVVALVLAVIGVFAASWEAHQIVYKQ